jgi:hypothetical protein
MLQAGFGGDGLAGVLLGGAALGLLDAHALAGWMIKRKGLCKRNETLSSLELESERG